MESLITKIINCAYEVHKNLSPGYLEKIYQNALIHEFALNGINAQENVPIKVLYKGIVVGSYIADVVVEDEVILELKAVRNLDVNAETQLVNYLTATKRNHGLLINFGSANIQIKRKFRLYSPIHSNQNNL